MSERITWHVAVPTARRDDGAILTDAAFEMLQRRSRYQMRRADRE
jgi:hypothetical protein